MYEATSVYMSSIAVQGSVLAPYATVDGGGGNIDGQLICKYLKGGLEYHPYFFTGCLLLPDP
jgi:choice-of-anchor A domain-containing protein